MTTNKVTCGKCGGNGLYFFSGGRSGVCFPCEGTGVVDYRSPTQAPARDCNWAASARQMLRTWYRNARRDSDHPCFVTLEDVLDSNSCGWTEQGLSDALDLVPGSREAFRSIGWAV